jgi:hypothetical protein
MWVLAFRHIRSPRGLISEFHSGIAAYPLAVAEFLYLPAWKWPPKCIIGGEERE